MNFYFVIFQSNLSVIPRQKPILKYEYGYFVGDQKETGKMRVLDDDDDWSVMSWRGLRVPRIATSLEVTLRFVAC